MNKEKHKKNVMSYNEFKKALPLLLMTVPFFLLIVVFSYVPLWGWSIAFVDYLPGNKIWECSFVGLKWFKRLFAGGAYFTRALRNTLVFSGIGLLLTPLPMIFAILLNELRNERFKKVVQTVSSFPNFISWVITYSIAFAFFSLEGGAVNQLLTKWGILEKGIDFLASVDLVWIIQPILGIWKGLGWSAIIYLSAIAGLDMELFDAAKVDGAGRLQQILHVMLPGLLPTFSMLLLMGTGNILSAGFDQYYTFDNAFVRERMDVLDTYAYRIGLGELKFSLSTAVGMFKSIVGLSLMSVANCVYKRINGSGLI